MKKILLGLAALILASVGYIAYAAPCFVNQGCTGQSSIPLGSVLVGSSTNQSLLLVSTTTLGSVLWISPAGLPQFTATSTLGISSGGGTPGGSNTQVQYNNSGSFGGNSNFTFNATTGNLVVTATSTLGTRVVGASTQSVLVNSEYFIVGTSSPLFYPTTGVDSSNIIIDKPNAASDASVLLSSLGAGKWEMGMAGDTNLYWKRINGTQAGGYTFYNILYADYASGNVGIGTQSPSQQLTVASTSPVTAIAISNQASSGENRAEIILNASVAATNLFMGTDAGANGGQNFFINWGGFGTGLFMNSNTDIGINQTSPVGTFDIKARATTIPFNVASSSGTSYLQVAANGSTTISSLNTAGFVKSDGTGLLFNDATSYQPVLSGGSNGRNVYWTSASTLGSSNDLFDNGTVSGVNATSSAVNFNIKGTAGLDPFNITSSTGISIFKVTQFQTVGIGSTTPSAILSVQGTSTSPTLDLFRVASSTNASILTVTSGSNVGIGTTTPLAILQIQGNASTSPTNLLFDVSSSTGSSILTVTPKGNVGIGSTTPANAFEVNGNMEMYKSNAAGNMIFGINNKPSGSYWEFINKGADQAQLIITHNNDGTFPAMYISNSVGAGYGAVLIKGAADTTVPNSFLSVNGNASIGNNFTAPTNGLFVQGSGIFGTSTNIASLGVTGTTTAPTLPLFIVASSTGTQILTVAANGNIGINSSSPTSALTFAQGTTAPFGINFGGDINLYRSGANLLTMDKTFIITTSEVVPAIFGGLNANNNLQLNSTFNSTVGRVLLATTGGNVGVGTFTPLSTFYVSGTTTSPTIPPFIVASSTGAQIVTVLANGNVGFNTSTPAYGFVNQGTAQLNGLTTSAGLQTAVVCLDANNQVISDSVACLASSKRFKQNISPLDTGLDEVERLNPVSFFYRPSFNGKLQSNPNYNGPQVGFIAEDVLKVDPRLVVVETSGVYKGQPAGFRYENFTAILTKAIQDVEKQITGILFRLNTQDSKIQTLQTQLDKQNKSINILQQEIIQLQNK